MRTIGIKALKDKLSEYVRIAASGETVLISDRDRVVAEMGPPSAARGPEVGDAAIAAMVREGIISPSTRRKGLPLTRAPESERIPLEELLRGMDEDRADRW